LGAGRPPPGGRGGGGPPPPPPAPPPPPPPPPPGARRARGAGGEAGGPPDRGAGGHRRARRGAAGTAAAAPEGSRRAPTRYADNDPLTLPRTYPMVLRPTTNAPKDRLRAGVERGLYFFVPAATPNAAQAASVSRCRFASASPA